MGKPKVEIKDKEYYKDIHFLYEIINTFKMVDELKLFLKDILTKSELRMLKRRWHVANLLMRGLDIRSAANESKTSTQTVIRIKQILQDGQGGLKLAIERMNEKIVEEKKNYKNNRIKMGSKFVKGWFS